MGKHSAGTNGVFWRTLFLTILKWIAISIIPILAVIGGWNWLSDRNSAGTPPQDDPAMIDPTADGTSSPASGTPSDGQGRTQILNGSGDPANLTAAQRKLEGAGYEIVTTGDASRRYDQTTVFYQDGHESQAQDLGELLGASVSEPAPDNLDRDIPLAVVLGADFQP